MLVGIIGPGAIGTMVAAYCQQVGLESCFFGRQGALPYQQIIEIGNRTISLDLRAKETADLFVLAVKSYQVVKALSQHQTILSNKDVLVVANGWFDFDLLDYINHHSPSMNIKLGCTTIASAWLQDHYKVINNQGSFVWDQSHASAAEIDLSNMLQSFGFKMVEDCHQVRQVKWLFNTTINSLCGALKLSENKQCFEHQDKLAKLFKESYQLGQQLLGPWEETAETLWKKLTSLIHNTGENRNSMYVDVIERRRTESEHLAGLVFREEENRTKFPTLWQIAETLAIADRNAKGMV